MATMRADTLRMSAQVYERRLGHERPLAPVWVALIAYSAVVLVFCADWITPASVVIGVAYEAPVVFAALKGKQRLTMSVVLLSSFGIALGWLIDLMQASFQYSDSRIANRLLSLISVWIVGSLAIVIQRGARHTEELEADRTLRRETTLSTAMDRVMSARSPGSTIQALAGEAPRLLEAVATVWCSTEADGAYLGALAGDAQAKALDVKASGSFAALLQRLKAQRSVDVVSAAATVDYLFGKDLGCKSALAIPIECASNVVGVVFAAVDAQEIGDRAIVEAGNFAKFASIAVQQSRYVDQLANR
jgi:hypothetical protein